MPLAIPDEAVAKRGERLVQPKPAFWCAKLPGMSRTHRHRKIAMRQRRS